MEPYIIVPIWIVGIVAAAWTWRSTSDHNVNIVGRTLALLIVLVCTLGPVCLLMLNRSELGQDWLVLVCCMISLVFAIATFVTWVGGLGEQDDFKAAARRR